MSTKFKYLFPEGYTPPERIEHNIDEIIKAGELDLKESEKNLAVAIEKRDSIKQRITETKNKLSDLRGKLPGLKDDFENAVLENQSIDRIQNEMQKLNSEISTNEMCLKSLSNALPVIINRITKIKSEVNNARCAAYVADLIKLAPEYNNCALQLAETMQCIGRALFNIKALNPELKGIPGLDFKQFTKVMSHLEYLPVLYSGFTEDIKLKPNDFRYYWIYRPETDLPTPYAHRRDFTFDTPWKEVSPYLPHPLKETDQEGNVSR